MHIAFSVTSELSVCMYVCMYVCTYVCVCVTFCPKIFLCVPCDHHNKQTSFPGGVHRLIFLTETQYVLCEVRLHLYRNFSLLHVLNFDYSGLVRRLRLR